MPLVNDNLLKPKLPIRLTQTEGSAYPIGNKKEEKRKKENCRDLGSYNFNPDS